eukprot:snap_masked-scaffold_4-processed-gene-1.6-mRNA-1 protein AED:0.31 eAED:0.32 QI:0/-1/0/1/-1/1/1/0/160
METNEKISKSTFELLVHEFISSSMIKSPVSPESTKLQAIFFDIGSKLSKYLPKKQIDTTKPETEIDKLKFICKNIWNYLFNKSVDKLQTNHSGTYILHDLNFPWFRCSLLNDGFEIYTLILASLLEGALTAEDFKVQVSIQLKEGNGFDEVYLAVSLEVV